MIMLEEVQEEHFSHVLYITEPLHAYAFVLLSVCRLPDAEYTKFAGLTRHVR